MDATCPVESLEAAAHSLHKGHTVKEVTLDPKTLSLSQELTAMLPVMVQTPTKLVRAASAFSRLRIYHAPLFKALEDIPVDAWHRLPPFAVAEVVAAEVQFRGATEGLRERWAGALSSGCGQLSPTEVAKVAWAASSLRMGEFHLLGKRVSERAADVDWRDLGWSDVGRLAWGAAKMMPRGYGPPWVERFVNVAESHEPQSLTGTVLGQVLWACAHLQLGESVRYVSGAALAQKKGLGRDAYAILLRDAVNSVQEARVFQHLAKYSRSPGLRSAVLNVACLRLLKEGRHDEACAVLIEMASDSLWNRVTYQLAGRLSNLQGSCTPAGSPPFPGLVEPGPGSHKYVRAAYHALAHGSSGDPASVMLGLEDFSRKKGWLKFGSADEKGEVISDALRRWLSRSGQTNVVVEYGTFLGYSALRMAQVIGAEAHIVSFEMDPEVACLAVNLIEHAGVQSVDVWVGQSEDLVERLVPRFGRQSVGFVYMDHNQMTYHQDVAQLETQGVLADGALLVATQVLKPGAPLLLWRLVEAQAQGACLLDVVSAPDCGCPMMEDWVVVAELRSTPLELADPPRELVLLAVECNLMRWRTAQGLVDERRWNEFVQHVRRTLELEGIQSTRDVWPDASVRARAQRLTHDRMDFFDKGWR